MNAKKLHAVYGLKWNPFSADVPVEGLLVDPRVESFLWRVESLVSDGGFALVDGDPGGGKSVVLRILADRLASMPDVVVGILTRPQSRTGDFYRELGDIFGVKMSPANRYGGFKALRERWRAHLESSLLRPVLLVDEAQAMAPEVLDELRILSSTDFDSNLLLTAVLAGDSRLEELLRREDLVPLGSRIRTRLHLGYADPDDLRALLKHVVSKAGCPALMTDELIDTLVDHAGGNRRTLMMTAADLLAHGLEKELARLDEKLFFEVFQTPLPRRRRKEKKS